MIVDGLIVDELPLVTDLTLGRGLAHPSSSKTFACKQS